MLKHKNNDISLSLPSLKCHLNQFLFADSYNKLRPIIDKTEKVTFDANISTNMTLIFIAWIKELFLLANANFYWRSNYVGGLEEANNISVWCRRHWQHYN